MNPSAYSPRHFRWDFADGIATITLNRPEKKNPLTFDSYAELRDTFRALESAQDVRSIVVTGAGENFCSGGDVHEIIGPLVNMPREGLAEFTKMTGDLVIAMLECPQIIVGAIDGVCAGAGAAIAMACDMRVGTNRSRIAFLFVRVGLAGCDMGACAVLPRLIGHGRAAELLYTGRTMPGDEAHRWGFFNRVHEPGELQAKARELAAEIARGPVTAHRATKRQLLEEWDMGVIDAVRLEADVQAELMETRDFRRAYEAFSKRETPRFEGGLMGAKGHLDWPFFEAAHRALAREAGAWCESELDRVHPVDGVDSQCRALVAAMGSAGFLRHSVIAKEGGSIDVRAACVLREVFAQHWGLADFAFAMQGLGSGPISIAGTPEQRRRFCAPAAEGSAIAAFAISEAGAGSDVTAMSTRARRDGAGYVIDGEKTWISNAGIADFYVVFARTADTPSRHVSAFVVEADNPGLSVIDRIEVTAPHPLGTLRFSECRVHESMRIGEEGRGMAVALGTLDVFRSTVGAAALGFARRAMAEARRHARERRAFGGTLSELDGVRRKLGQMATAIDASALLVYRAAWTKDTTGGRITSEAAMAKSFATESAQRVIDDAVQILGARGVVAGSLVEELYREIRPLRIYEGATEIQELVIARELLADDEEGGA